MAKLMFHARQLSDLELISEKLLTAYPDARLFAFFGMMGAGKTTFIQVLCKTLGVTETVGSPSFSIVNHYLAEGAESIYHFDFYRIDRLEEVYDLGYEHYFFSGNYCFIEWPDKLGLLLPPDCVRVDIEDHGGERIFRF